MLASTEVSSIVWLDAVELPELYEIDDPGERAHDIIRMQKVK